MGIRLEGLVWKGLRLLGRHGQCNVGSSEVEEWLADDARARAEELARQQHELAELLADPDVLLQEELA